MTHPDTRTLLGIVSYRIYPAENGGQQSIATFYAELNKRVNLTLLVSRDNELDPASNLSVFPVLYSGYLNWMNLLLVYKLKKLMRQREITCLLIDHSYYAWLAWVLRRITGIPFIIRSHNIEAHRFKELGRWYWRWDEKYEKWIHNRSDYNWWISRNDMKYANKSWKIPATKCAVTTYGTLLRNEPDKSQKKAQRNQLLQEWNLPESVRLFYFNGSLNYAPNVEAIRTIVYDILPRLQQKNIPFRIVISGTGLSAAWQAVLATYPDIIWVGFKNEIALYWEGCDCFINPVTLGSGIKTKLIESLANGLPSVSTLSGMRGLERPNLNKVLIGVEDYDWDTFTERMVQITNPDVKWRIPLEFFQEFSLPNIVQGALLSLQTDASH